ncbi:DNA cytosine methyltransferase [Pantoea ananatis]|uniref:DNA cytosine methyltransferase n=1 Tax=Pantoea ananas TaxID=553 RepID=UPI001E2BB87A|nr:DNA cytosine methyltransferase [Pantoea ananatis]
MIEHNFKKLNAVDLFSGGGGLTVGLKMAGFDVKAAVELDKHAASTFQANHRDTKLFIQDIKFVKGHELLEQTSDGYIDLLSACPPCQGFTSLTAKYKREDPRNLLINEMLRVVEETSPKAIMMENVPGLANRGQHLLNPVINKLKSLGYLVNYGVLQVADYGVPQYRKRFVLLAGKGFDIPLPNGTHCKDGMNKPKWVTVKETIGDMDEPITLSQAKKQGAFPISSWHIVRDLSEINKARLREAKPGLSWKCIPEELRPNCHKGNYNGFTNVYGRMDWDSVSPTITGGCTTLSRGRYGHPEKNRTISVREAAKLQTFPDDYIFDTSLMERVCVIIGNALPCKFAEFLAKHCKAYIEKN